MSDEPQAKTVEPKSKRRPTTPFDDDLLKLTTMLCIRCGGAIRLDMNAKAVYAKFKWRKYTEIPERIIAADLGLCVETIADATRRLECCGLLVVHRNRGKKRWNRYALTSMEAVQSIGFGPPLHRVFTDDKDPADFDIGRKPAPCRCLPAVHRSRKKKPTPPDAVHPVPPDAYASDTARCTDPTPPDAMSKEMISKEMGAKKGTHFVRTATVRFRKPPPTERVLRRSTTRVTMSPVAVSMTLLDQRPPLSRRTSLRRVP